ncbi:MAG: hypothetical protein WCF36_07940 [Candidatus Nanopelagicales bacterium]
MVIHPLFVVVGVVALLVTIPGALLLLALLVLVVPGRLRVLRLVGFALVYFTLEVVVLIVALLARLASGFGWARTGGSWPSTTPSCVGSWACCAGSLRTSSRCGSNGPGWRLGVPMAIRAGCRISCW